jgi:ribosomal protein S27AE
MRDADPEATQEHLAAAERARRRLAVLRARRALVDAEQAAREVGLGQELVYHLLTNEARVRDPETGKERPVLKPTDKVVTACAWFEANRAPGVEHPAGRPVVLTRRDGIARGAGVHADTVGKTLDHVSAVGLVVKEVRTAFRDGKRHEDMYLGAPATMLRNTDPLPMEAAHRAKDRRRKKCPNCGASVFVHRTVCGGCGEILNQHVDGDDEAAVAEVRAKLDGAAQGAARASTSEQTGRPQTEDSSDIPYSAEESSEIKEYNHVSLTQDSSSWRPVHGLFAAGELQQVQSVGQCSDCGQSIEKAYGRCAPCRRAEYARLEIEEYG